MREILEDIEVRLLRARVRVPVIVLLPLMAAFSFYAAIYFAANSPSLRARLLDRLSAAGRGDWSVGALRIGADLRAVELRDVRLAWRGEPIVAIPRATATFHPWGLLSRRVDLSEVRFERPKVSLSIDDREGLNLLAALGLGAPEESDEANEELARGEVWTVALSEVSIERGDYAMSIEGVGAFSIERIDFFKGSLTVDPNTLLIIVERARAGRADFSFVPELFGFEPERGAWTFGVDAFEVEGWRWAGDGFSAERVRAALEGHRLVASGSMSFPDDERVLTYAARATIEAAYWSELLEYFVGDTLAYSIPEFRIEGGGTIDAVRHSATLRADLIDAAGVRIDRARAELSLIDSMLEVKNGELELYGGRATVHSAYFDLFELTWAGDVSLDRVDPRGFARDFLEVDLPELDGALSGRARWAGRYPRGDREAGPLGPSWLDRYDDAWIDLRLTEPLRFEPAALLLPHWSRVVAREGARFRVGLDRLSLTDVRLALGADRATIDDLELDLATLRIAGAPDQGGARIALRSSALGALLGAGASASADDALIEARLWGPVFAPDADLRARSGPLRAEGEPIADAASAALRLRSGSIWVDEASAQIGAGRASIRGRWDALRARPDPGAPDSLTYRPRSEGAIEVSVSLDRVPIKSYARLSGLGVPIGGGVLSARARIGGTSARPTVCGEASALEVEIGAEVVRSASIRGGWGSRPGPEGGCLAIEGGGGVIEALRVEHEAGAIGGSGSIGPGGELDLRAIARGVRLERVRSLQGALAGGVDLYLELGGSLARPRPAASVRAQAVRAGPVALGDLAVALETIAGDRSAGEADRVVVSGALIPWFEVSAELPLSGAQGGDQGYYARIEFEDLDALDLATRANLLALGGRGAERLAERVAALEVTRVSGAVELFAPLDLETISGTARLDKVELGPAEARVRNQNVWVLGATSGPAGTQILIEGAAIELNGRSVVVDGPIALDPGFLDLQIEGAVDLAALELARRLAPDLYPSAILETRGVLYVSARLFGDPAAPKASGAARVGPSAIALRALREPIELRSGRLVFGRDGARIERDEALRGFALGGEFSIWGEAVLDEFAPRSLDLYARTRSTTIRVPQTARAVLDSSLRLSAPDALDPQSWRLSGSVEVLDALYSRDLSFVEQQLTGRVLDAFERRIEIYEGSALAELAWLEPVQLEVKVRARDGIRLQNRIERFDIDLELRADLDLRQTVGRPALFGGVEVIDGSVAFQGERFAVRDGVVRWRGDPRRPWVDVSALAQVRNACRDDVLARDFTGQVAWRGAVTTPDDDTDEIYQIALQVRGEVDNLGVRYESVPYADQRDIVSLILTGCTVDLLSASSASQPTLEALLGPLIGRLEREIQRAVRLEEIDIVPGVERTQVRVGNALTRRLSWRFQLEKGFDDLSATGQAARLTYRLTDGLSASIAESTYSDINTTSRLGLDLRLSYRLSID